jgi:hypothetical protein
MSTDADLQRALELSRQTNQMDVDAGITEIPGLSAVRKKFKENYHRHLIIIKTLCLLSRKTLSCKKQFQHRFSRLLLMSIKLSTETQPRDNERRECKYFDYLYQVPIINNNYLIGLLVSKMLATRAISTRSFRPIYSPHKFAKLFYRILFKS